MNDKDTTALQVCDQKNSNNLSTIQKTENNRNIRVIRIQKSLRQA